MRTAEDASTTEPTLGAGSRWQRTRVRRADSGVAVGQIARAAEVDRVIGKRAGKLVVVYAVAVAVDHDSVIARAADRGIVNIVVAAVELDNGNAAVLPGVGSAVDLPVRVVVLSQRSSPLAQLPAGVAANGAVYECVVRLVVAEADDAAAIGGV